VALTPRCLLVAAALLVGCGTPGPSATAQAPWSYRLASFRYLEPADAYAHWLRDGGVPGWVAGRSGVDGTWFEVHAGAAESPGELAMLRERLVGLGVEAFVPADFRRWAADSVPVDDYALYGYDAERSPSQLGTALHEVTRAFPCSPRFELISYGALQRVPDLSRQVVRYYEPDDLDPLIQELADADPGEPVVAHAAFEDLPTGERLDVSLVWRTPSDEQPATTGRWAGPGFDWAVASIRDEPRDDGQLVRLLWSPDGSMVAAVTASSDAGYPLSEQLFDRSTCRGGAFSYAALWRPLGVLPDRFARGDAPFAVETSILGQDYVDMKGGARWARRMKGRWSFSEAYLHEAEDAWSANLFDLESAEEAEEVHGRLYTRQMERSWGSGRNRASKRAGGDGIYRVSVLGVPAWYVDQWSRQRLKELNFVQGPWVFAFGSFVASDNPLRMESLKARAAMVPALSGKGPDAGR
jgi:hypothetical protein